MGGGFPFFRGRDGCDRFKGFGCGCGGGFDGGFGWGGCGDNWWGRGRDRCKDFKTKFFNIRGFVSEEC